MLLQIIEGNGSLVIKKFLISGNVIYGRFTKTFMFLQQISQKAWDEAVAAGGVRQQIRNLREGKDPFPEDLN